MYAKLVVLSVVVTLLYCCSYVQGEEVNFDQDNIGYVNIIMHSRY